MCALRFIECIYSFPSKRLEELAWYVMFWIGCVFALKPFLSKTPNLSDSCMEPAHLAAAGTCCSKDSSFEIQKADFFFFCCGKLAVFLVITCM